MPANNAMTYKLVDKCWLYQGPVHATGYGIYHRRYAHRISYEYFYGKLDKEFHIHHICGNKLCIRPTHLLAVTASEHSRLHRIKTRIIQLNSRDFHNGEESPEVVDSKGFTGLDRLDAKNLK